MEAIITGAMAISIALKHDKGEMKMFRELKRKNKQISNEECIRLLKTEMRGVLSVLGTTTIPMARP